ncbi:MlaD family protein [Rhizobium sp. PAMB 3174]
METKANYTIVGIFTLLIIAAAFGFVYWMSGFGGKGPTVELLVRIPGSANGLSVGSPVRFNGIAIGSVRDLRIDSDPRFTVAYTEVRADAPVYSSTKAVLEIQGLTGAAYIELSGGDKSNDNILQEAMRTGKRAVIVADQSSVTNLLATADKILDRADDAIGQLQGFISDARAPLTQTVNNAKTFSDALARNADGIDKFLKSVSALSDSVTGLSGRLDSTLDAIEKLVKAVDAERINNILANAEKVSKDVADSSGELKSTVQSFKTTAESISKAGDKAANLLDNADKLIVKIDPAKLGMAVDNIAAAAADARVAIASFKNVGDTVDKHQQDIDDTIQNVTEMAKKLNAASNRVDGILAKVDGMVSSDDSQGMFAQASETLKSIKTLADNLNAQVGPIAANLNKFSSSGLRDVEGLVDDARRTVKSLEDTINNLDDNPQRLLFGGGGVKEYDGRTRR